MDIEFINRNKLISIQNRRFAETFKNLLKVPYYKQKIIASGINIKDIKTLKDLNKLPFINKEDLINCYPQSDIACSKSNIVKYHFTSGTKGKPLAVGYTEKDIKIMANCLNRLFKASGMTANSIIQNSYGYGLFSGGLSFHEAICEFGATVIPTSVGNDERQIKLLEDFGADTLCATPSYTLHLANKIVADGVKDLSLKRCICGAEPWSENMKGAIENLLHVEAYDVYGMAETGVGVAYSCKFRDGLHVCEDYFYVEIVDPLSGENIRDEKVGELVITSLVKEGLPLIRYKTGDLTHFILQPCKCGRTHRRIARIIGRTDDMLIVKGVNVYPLEIESLVHSIGGLEGNDFEIILDTVDSLDRLTLRIEADEQILEDENFKINIEEMFKQKFGIRAEVELVGFSTIHKHTGKKKYVRDLRIK